MEMAFGPSAGAERRAFLQPIRDLIEAEGYGRVIDADPEERQLVCYTVGLTQRGYPELIAGLEDFTDFPEGAPGLLQRLARMLLERDAGPAEGDILEVHGQWVRLIPETLYQVHCNVAHALYGPDFSLLQVLACSPNSSERRQTLPICLN